MYNISVDIENEIASLPVL